LDALVRRQIIRWQLTDALLVEVHLHLNEELTLSPIQLLQRDPTWFDNEGMIYTFDLIDPTNRMLVHAFRFQVFYQSDEQTLLVARGIHMTAMGL